MAAKTNKAENQEIDFLYRGQTLTRGGATATWNQAPVYYYGILSVSAWITAWTPALNTFIVRPDSAGTLHLLKCTTSGAVGGTAPIAPTANNGTVTDGSAVWTDQYAALEAATIASFDGTTLPVELTGGTYARQSITASLANYAGTQAAGSTAASSGTSGTTSPNNALTFNAGTGGNAGLWFETDAAGVNVYLYGFITSGPIALATDAIAVFSAGALVIQIDS